MKIKDLNLVQIVCLLLFGIIFFIIQNHQDEKSVDIERNRIYSLGKVFIIDHNRNFRAARYFYFYQGLRYEAGDYIHTSGDEYLNKYFKIEFSSKSPKYSNIFLDHEIKDSLEIKNAGF
jgi:stress response protein SCP2